MREIDAVLRVVDQILCGQSGMRAGHAVSQSVMGEAGDDHVGAGGEKFFPELAELARGIGQSVQQDENSIGLVSVAQDDGAPAFVQRLFGLPRLLLFPAFHRFVVGPGRIGLGVKVTETQRSQQPDGTENEQRDRSSRDIQEDAHKAGIAVFLRVRASQSVGPGGPRPSRLRPAGRTSRCREIGRSHGRKSRWMHQCVAR